MTLCSCGSAIRPPSRAPTFRSSVAPTCFSTATAIADEPDLRPRQRRGREQGDRLAAEDLVADRLVEQVAARQADRLALALVEDALGLQQQRLAEALGADDDELVVAPGREERVDLGRAVQQRVVEVLGDPDVVGVHGPRAHRPPSGCLNDEG